MENSASTSSAREVSSPIASRSHISNNSSNGSSSPSPASIAPCPCLHSQILKVREEDEHFTKAMEMLPFRFPASRMRDACSSSSRPSRLGLRTGSQGFVQ